MEKPPHWRVSALAVATALAFGMASPDASALALGRIAVQSALGEPLQASIELPDVTAEEANTLKVNVASPEAFRAAGLDYSSAIGNMQITLQRRPDGRLFLRLSSDRTVNEPFIDLILEANWASGRIVRDYTLLFDPPAMRASGPPPATIAQIPAAPAAPAAAGARPAPVPAPAPAATTRPAPAPTATARPAPAAPRPPSDGTGKQVTVQAGDTAGRIAGANKPPSVSLDQMLVALLQANPNAFIDGNINRLKAGAVLDLPGPEAAALMEPAEARRTIVAQSRDFNEFRRKLAQSVPETQVSAADRKTTGKIEARVDDKKPSAATPDKLTLSKGAVQPGKAVEDQIAKDRQAREAATRVAELNKNIAELSKLGAAAGAAPAASGAKPGVTVSTPAGVAAPASAAKPVASAPAAAAKASAPVVPPVAVASAPVVKASAPATPAAVAASAPAAPVAAVPAAVTATAAVPVAASAPAAPASAVVAAAPAVASPAPAAASAPKPAPKKPAPPPPPEPSLLDELLDNPVVPAAVGGALALLIGFGVYRLRQRKKSTQVDSSFLESRLQPDSFFGASGGQRIDTNEGNATGSSMVYSPSQLDAAGDVDPVAEADVYLAYGRDLQAEEILKEALRTNPSRVAIHGKLLEIYAKRRDAKAFELIANEAYGLTRGTGPDWDHICELGQELDPGNSLYRPGGLPASGGGGGGSGVPSSAAATQPVTPFTATATQRLPQEPPAPAPAMDLDLDLDFSIGDSPEPDTAASALESTAPMEAQRTVAMQAEAPAAPASLDMDMDFGSPTLTLPPTPAAAPAAVKLSAPDLALSNNDLSFSLELPSVDAPAAPAPSPTPAPAPVAAPAPAAADMGMLEFDLGGLSLDVGGAAPAAPAASTDGGDTANSPLSTGFDDTGSDPLATKLALAEEFSAIGDPDGARSLAEEVVAEASGALKAKAQRFLAELS